MLCGRPRCHWCFSTLESRYKTDLKLFFLTMVMLSLERQTLICCCHETVLIPVLLFLLPDMSNTEVHRHQSDCRPTRRDSGLACSFLEYLDESKGKNQTPSDAWFQCQRLFRPEYFRISRTAPSCRSKRVVCDGASGRRWMWCRACSRALTWCRLRGWPSIRVAEPKQMTNWIMWWFPNTHDT